ncbi:hypothetical protein RB195_017574 [Necator americanus]|uniref:Mos1 transposase HTH domain-containing protein n=1 Tax=Necator americanus TaxID=51031 RepID=A0ABR1C7Q2_NECAM
MAAGDSTEIHSERSVRAWFQRFKAGNEKFEDEPHSGRQTAISFDELKNLAEQHPHEGVRYFAANLGCCPPSRRFDWPDTIVTGGEKWALYVNHTHKRAWCAGDEMPDPFVKGEIHEKKVMLNVWWGVRGIYSFELLPDNPGLLRSTASSATFACCTITRALTSRRRLLRKFWSSDGKFYRTHRRARLWSRATTASSDRFSITWRRSATMLENDLRAFFAFKSPKFYAKGIRNLVRHWQKVADVYGDYFVE